VEQKHKKYSIFSLYSSLSSSLLSRSPSPRVFFAQRRCHSTSYFKWCGFVRNCVNWNQECQEHTL